MNIADIAEKVKTKEDFISFLQQMQMDYKTSRDSWENPELERYLEAMEAFLTDSTERSLNKIDFTPSWSLFARIMIAASIYE
jgi:hypothetical protein